MERPLVLYTDQSEITGNEDENTNTNNQDQVINIIGGRSDSTKTEKDVEFEKLIILKSRF